MARRYAVTIAGQARTVELEELEGGVVRAVVDGRERRLDVRAFAHGRYSFLDGTSSVPVDVEGTAPKLSVALGGQVLAAEVADAEAQALTALAGRAQGRVAGPVGVRAPMPGRLAKLLVKTGDEVKAGQALLVIEAMKMENEIRAPRAGRVTAVPFAEGVPVEAGQELVTLE